MGALSDTQAAVEAYVVALERHDVSRLADIVATNVTGHEAGGDVGGIDALRGRMAAWLAAFPDMRVATDDLFADGDRAAWRWTVSGTHSGVNRTVSTTGIIIFRVAEGRIAEYWGQYDRLGLQEQLQEALAARTARGERLRWRGGRMAIVSAAVRDPAIEGG